MVSVDGLLDAHEVDARARVSRLRVQAARIADLLAVAEAAVEAAVTTRRTLALVLAGQGEVAWGPEPEPVAELELPTWREGLGEADLPISYRGPYRQVASGDGSVRPRAVAVALGLELADSPLQCLRYRLRRLSEHGWLLKLPTAEYAPVPGRLLTPDGAEG